MGLRHGRGGGGGGGDDEPEHRHSPLGGVCAVRRSKDLALYGSVWLSVFIIIIYLREGLSGMRKLEFKGKTCGVWWRGPLDRLCFGWSAIS